MYLRGNIMRILETIEYTFYEFKSIYTLVYFERLQPLLVLPYRWGLSKDMSYEIEKLTHL